MKTRYKHIHFEETGQLLPKPAYWCKNNKPQTTLGLLEYYPPWHKYVFSGDRDCVFDESCLLDIVDFLKQLGALKGE